MQIKINAGHHIERNETLISEIEAAVDATLRRFRDRITRAEVYLKDENGPAVRGDDIRCVIEARPAGLRPVAVRHRAATVGQAIDGAAAKLERLLDGTFGRLRSPTRGPIRPGSPAA